MKAARAKAKARETISLSHPAGLDLPPPPTGQWNSWRRARAAFLTRPTAPRRHRHGGLRTALDAGDPGGGRRSRNRGARERRRGRAADDSAASAAREPVGIRCTEATARPTPLVGRGRARRRPDPAPDTPPAGFDRILRTPSCRSGVRSAVRSGNRSGAPLRTDPHPSPFPQVRPQSHANSQPDLIYRIGPFRST
jgi:hypothetical protein